MQNGILIEYCPDIQYHFLPVEINFSRPNMKFFYIYFVKMNSYSQALLWFYASPQRVCSTWQIAIFPISTLVCVSSYVSSMNLCESKQIDIGCICLIFLHYVFPNELSNSLHEEMKIYTDCICLTFL